MTRTPRRPTRFAARIAIAFADTGPVLPPVYGTVPYAWDFCFLPTP